MKVQQLIQECGFKHIAGQSVDREIKDLYVGDLLSWVISHAKEGNAWLTVQTHVNIVAIAVLLELSCIIILEDAPIDEDTIEKANEENIIILQTKDKAYDVFQILAYLGL